MRRIFLRSCRAVVTTSFLKRNGYIVNHVFHARAVPKCWQRSFSTEASFNRVSEFLEKNELELASKELKQTVMDTLEYKYQMAQVLYYEGKFDECIKEISSIIVTKKDDVKNEKKMLEWVQFFKKYFENYLWTNEEKQLAKFDNCAVPILQIANEFEGDKRFELVENILESRVQQIAIDAEENAELFVFQVSLMKRLGDMYLEWECILDAIEYYKIAIETIETLLGPEDIAVAAVKADLGKAYLMIEDLPTAKQVLLESLQLFNKLNKIKLEPHHEIKKAQAFSLFAGLILENETDDAVIGLKKAIKIYEKYKIHDSYVLKSMLDLAKGLEVQDKVEEAEKIAAKAEQMANSLYADQKKKLADFYCDLGCYYAAKDMGIAELHFRKALEMYKSITPKKQFSEDIPQASHMLAISLCFNNKQEEAVQLVDSVLAYLNKHNQQELFNEMKSLKQKIMEKPTEKELEEIKILFEAMYGNKAE